MERPLILIGLLIVAIGLLWPWLSRLPLGQPPGDIVTPRERLLLLPHHHHDPASPILSLDPTH